MTRKVESMIGVIKKLASLVNGIYSAKFNKSLKSNSTEGVDASG